MAFAQSPGVTVREFPVGGSIPGVATAIGAIAGVFRWGPIGQIIQVDSQDTLALRLGTPTNFNAETWFSGSNFLDYTDNLLVSRAANTTGSSPTLTASLTTGNAVVTTSNTASLNAGMILMASSNTLAVYSGATISAIINSTAFSFASGNTVTGTDGAAVLQFVSNTTAFNAIVNTASVSNLQAQIVRTEDHFIEKYADSEFDTDVSYVARWAGDLGNSLKISQCDSANAFTSNVDLTATSSFVGNVAFVVNSNTAILSMGANTGNDTFNVNTFNSALASVIGSFTVGDYLMVGNDSIGTQNLKITAVPGVANIGLSANVSVTLNVQSTSANLVTTANAFADVANGDWIVVFSNTSNWRTLRISNVVDSNNVVLTSNAGFTNATSNWALLNASSRAVVFNLEDRYKRSSDWSTSTITRTWEYASIFDAAPAQSSWQIASGNTSAEDELHVVVVDEDGKFSGDAGAVLEKYSFVSRATDALSEDGTSNYYRNIINDVSQYVWAVNDISGATSNTGKNLVDSTNSRPFTSSFQYGFDGSNESTIAIGNLTDAWDLFASTEEVDISLLITGKNRGGVNGAQLANYLVDNIAEQRMDCVVFVSPEKSDVVNNVGYEAADIVTFANDLRSSTYLFIDSNYKYQYDRYNDIYRYIPLNGDMAGLAAQTEQTNDAWWSFAGFNRGHVKNVVRLAWNPKKSYRDTLYKNSVNPVVTFPGEGTILYGDKTGTRRSSVFESINVRRLFIVLEKAIAKQARYTLFEFNDAYTRAAFRNLVIPFLRDIQGRRGIQDFEVICDGTNNTDQVINTQRFVADIKIKPSRSINYIELNFYGVPNGVAFSEVARSN